MGCGVLKPDKKSASTGFMGLTTNGEYPVSYLYTDSTMYLRYGRGYPKLKISNLEDGILTNPVSSCVISVK